MISNDREIEDIKEIKEILNRKLETDLKDFEQLLYKDFHVGEFVYSPNQFGFFKRDSNWYSYEIDERNFCTFSGPFSKTGIIHVCGFMLHAKEIYNEYQFTKEEENIFMHNNFHSLDEIDKYCKNRE